MFSLKVYYKDTDCGNVVYYAKYLEFLEIARTEFIQEKDFSIKALHDEGFIFPVVNVNVTYHAPAKLGDILFIPTKVVEVRGCSFTLYNEVLNESRKKLVTATTKLASVNTEGKPVKIPTKLLTFLRKNQNEQ